MSLNCKLALTGLLLAFCLNIHAQSRETKPRIQNNELRNQRLTKTELSAKAVRGNTARGTKNVAGFSDIELSESEASYYVSAYKVDFLPTVNKDDALVSIKLYAGRNRQVGVIHFYNEDAKGLKKASSVNKQKNVTFNYPMSMLPYVQDFISNTAKIAIIYDVKAKTAYFTSDVLMMR